MKKQSNILNNQNGAGKKVVHTPRVVVRGLACRTSPKQCYGSDGKPANPIRGYPFLLLSDLRRTLLIH